MATHFNTISSRATIPPPNTTKLRHPFALFTKEQPPHSQKATRKPSRYSIIIRASNGGDSYLDMWKKAIDREKKSIEFQRIVDGSVVEEEEEEEEESKEVLERKSVEFQKLLEVSSEERDRVQRMQVIDRAAAAIAAARALLKEDLLPQKEDEDQGEGELILKSDGVEEDQPTGIQDGGPLVSQFGTSGSDTPGPSFWAWTPPSSDNDSFDGSQVKSAGPALPYAAQNNPVMEKEQSVDILSIPFESTIIQSKHNPILPPLQSHVEVEELEGSSSTLEIHHSNEERELGVQFSAHAAEAAQALNEATELSTQGVNPNGSRWWKETGIEQRPDGVVCKWTLTRGVTADGAVEWEEKYWEAADDFGYKELGSEKSGRDAAGNVWREYWRESMLQSGGLVHLEKTADKWGRNLKGEEWQEKWWEHYDASGQAEKWAHKWCSIDPYTPVEAGHAHVWHERWGEKYDGHGGSIKYTDKWAECFEGDGWAKWGDKWDEHFDPNGHGVKQGETWWQGKHGDRWNRTWGEGHNGSGWVHKYGKSSSGEHWDTHVQQETWYERFPHYGFYHCFDNSVQLREVNKPSEWS